MDWAGRTHGGYLMVALGIWVCCTSRVQRCYDFHEKKCPEALTDRVPAPSRPRPPLLAPRPCVVCAPFLVSVGPQSCPLQRVSLTPLPAAAMSACFAAASMPLFCRLWATHRRKCQRGLNTSGVCTASPEALQLALRQHLGQFDYARHVRREVRPGKRILVETTERRRGDM